MKPVILLDAGHGKDTKGKRSPDGQILEYKCAREIVGMIAPRLKQLGFEVVLIETPADNDMDVSLQERCARANRYGKNSLLISVHLNAAGNGSAWMTGRGWEAWTSVGATMADKLAECLYNAATETLPAGTKIRTDTTDGDRDKEEQFYILKHTVMPAVLTENLFQDNKEDVAFLSTCDGKLKLAELHVRGIVKYVEKYC